MTTNFTYMTPAYREVIYKKYNIVDHLLFKKYDHNFHLLEEKLQSIKKDYFAPNERIIIEHIDTDYYFNDFDYGVGLYNLFTAFRKVDIPLFTMLLFTNHFGIAQEVNRLAPVKDDRPTIIETFVTTTHYPGNYDPIELNADQIQRPGLCMMGQRRVHRHAMFHFLESNNLLPLVATSVRGAE